MSHSRGSMLHGHSTSLTGDDSLTAAAGLLLWVAREVANGPRLASERDGLLAAMTDAAWADFLREALRHGMLPAAARSLASSGEAVPSGIAEDLRIAEALNAHRSLTMLGHLLATLHELDIAGVRAAPWKGPLLAQRAYGDVGHRYFFDLDVLVMPSQLRTARDVLHDLGFRNEKRMTEAQENAYVNHQGELEMVRDSDGLWFELHTAIVPNYYSRRRLADDLWDRVVCAPLGRSAVWALAPVDEIEALCVHGSKHRWERLAWILDIAMMARLLSDRNYQTLLTSARSHGTLRMVRLGLLLAGEVTGATLPDEIIRDARSDRTAVRLAGNVRRDLFVVREHLADGLVFHARMLERRRDRLAYLANVMFRPSGADWESIAVPRALFPVYALTRPIRLSVKYGRRVLRRGASGDGAADRARNEEDPE